MAVDPKVQSPDEAAPAVAVALGLTKHFGERVAVDGIALVRPLVAGQATDAVFLHLAALAADAVVGYLAATVFIRRRLIQ